MVGGKLLEDADDNENGSLGLAFDAKDFRSASTVHLPAHVEVGLRAAADVSKRFCVRLCALCMAVSRRVPRVPRGWIFLASAVLWISWRGNW